MTMNTAMRIRACIESLRLRRAVRRDASGATTRARQASAAPRPLLDTSPRRAVCHVAAFATIVIATLLAINAFVAAADDRHANHTRAAPRDCSARYAALLDLAELARRDGKSSEVVVRGLSEQGGALSDCLAAGRGAPAPR
ncbi:hypothetical protein [Paraburkholderia sp.]|uniref:hypothetical protein n=1 Tax=Paraburkholderia sp. TaxID=1926495 RepID=UPI0039E47727